jgi:hypothetical protein
MMTWNGKRSLVLAFSLLTGCGGPSFESEAVELEYLDSLSNPTPKQFLRRKELHAAAVRAAQEERIRLAEEERILREQDRILREQDRIRLVEEVERRMTPEEKAAYRENQASHDLEADYHNAEAKGMTPEAARAVYQSIIDRYPGTRAAAKARERLDELGTP